MADPIGRLGRGKGANVDETTLAVQGLAELQKALRETEGAVPKHLKDSLRGIGGYVRDKAAGNVRSRTGALASSIRTSATQRGVSVYSNLPYSRVQDQGGQVGRDKATLLPRANVSQYMTRAVRGSTAEVERRVERLLDDVQRDFDK